MRPRSDGPVLPLRLLDTVRVCEPGMSLSWRQADGEPTAGVELMFDTIRTAPNRQVELSPGPNPQIGTRDWRAVVNTTAEVSECVFEGCSRIQNRKSARGLCLFHYRKLRVSGRLDDFPGPQVFASEEDRFFAKVEMTGSCWVWTAGKNRRGYGVFSDGRNRSNVYAHRWVYEYLVGSIPGGLTIDHLCRNTSCVNPDHLEPVTLQDNIARKPARAFCVRGHDLNNAYIRKNGDRMCRECRKARREARND